jgi:hypothetical protein
MRIESSVTAISWIPSEAVEGMPRLPFEHGIADYDEPPPDRLEPGDLDRLLAENRFREANELKAWIEVDDGRIVTHGQEGRGLVGSTKFRFGRWGMMIPGVGFDVLRSEPEMSEESVRFVQTVGGRAGFPQPRRVRGKPFLRIHSATAWTSLGLTMRADGSSGHDIVAASPFPRHWIYDQNGDLTAKSGTVDFKRWYSDAHDHDTPWGAEESPSFIAAAETALERTLSRKFMQEGSLTERRSLDPGETLVEQGQRGEELYLLLDGFLAVEVDGEAITEIGPGAILGEGASLGDGTRTATLRAMVPCRVAPIPANLVEWRELEAIAAGRRD